MMKKLTAVLLIALTMTLLSAEKYAVLITGDYAAKGIPEDFLWQSTASDDPNKIVNPMLEFWYDTYLMWEMLIKKGFKDENIHVLFADGEDFYLTEAGQYVDIRYRPQYIGMPPGFTITKDKETSSATRANLEKVAEELKGKMHDDDFLFVWTFDHGGSTTPPREWNATIFLMPPEGSTELNDEMIDYEFAELFNPIKAAKKVYWMQQCYGGGFWDDLTYNIEENQNYDNVYFHSAVGITPASVADDRTKNMEYIEYLESELIDNVVYTHGEFNFHMYSVTMGCTPNTIYTNNYNGELFIDADTNSDGIISMSETSAWEISHESLDKLENPPPQKSDEDGSKFDYTYDQVPLVRDYGYIGYHTTLEYPTIILNNYPEYMTFIKGVMGIPDCLSIHQADLILPNGSNTTLLKNCNVDIYSDYNFINQTRSTLKLSDGSEINSANGGNIIFDTGSTLLVNGNVRIIGDIQLADGVTIEIRDNSILTVQLSQIKILDGTQLKLGKGARLIVENGSNLEFYDGSVVELGEGAEIIVNNGGCLNADGCSFTFTGTNGTWKGIKCEVGSQLNINRSKISGAFTGISGAPSNCRITNSSFLNCVNGISLANCPDYVITNNRMTGKGFNSYGYAQGVGITLTSCSMPLSENTVQNYAEGIKLVSSSVIMAKNKLTNNFNSGLLITGHGSKPVLVNSLSKDLTPRLNNEIYGNNIDYLLYNGAQIYMRYSAGAYMTGGYNNIYSGLSGAVPPVPCIRGVINTTEPTINKVLISAERNYWGYGNIDEVNQPDFFFFRHSTFDTGYSIDFDPYALVPYTSNGAASTELSTNEPRSTESTMLLNAMKLEETGSSKASIKLYENIIKKYPNTPEYYVAESRLPSLYIEEEMPLAALFSSYDEAIENETALGKKFFKGLRVSTHIKAKNYDTAIMYAEEMKNEAETDEEALLSEIDIAVSNLMKESLGSGKGANSSNQLDKLLGMLNGRKESESSATDITETVLPSQHELFQNYPNPFNPVTQIKFALAKTADVKLSVYNIAGQKVAELANGSRQAGVHTVDFDGSRFNSGVYYYTLKVDGKSFTKKMVLTK